MNVVSRGVRNAFRNSIRTVSIVLILGLSVGLALAMLLARQAVETKITSVKSSVGNTITISPAGVRGFDGGGELLTNDDVSAVSSTAHVSKVLSTLNDRLTSTTTNLQSPIDAGSFGRRQANNSGIQAPEGGQPPQSGSTTQTNRTFNFTPPVVAIGLSDSNAASAFGADTVTYTSGGAFNGSADENVAVIGKAVAEKNNLSVDSTFKMYDQDVKVVGIYDTGNTFANSGVFLPIKALQRLSSQTTSVNSMTVTVDSLDNIESTLASIKTIMGTKADVTSNQDTAKELVAPLENVKSISLFSLIGALVAGGVIILLTMMMIVRERRREIGVMKAIGASNVKVMMQFIYESLTFTILGLVVGLVIGAAASTPITKVLVNNSSSSTSTTQLVTAGGPGQGSPRNIARGFRAFGGNSIDNIKNIKASVGADILGYGLGAALLIAILGSAVPAFFISKIRPADVMRAD